MSLRNNSVNLSENVLYSCMKKNTVKPMGTLKKDAMFWLPKIKHEHFTWLSPEAQKQVQLVKTLDEF